MLVLLSFVVCIHHKMIMLLKFFFLNAVCCVANALVTAFSFSDSCVVLMTWEA